MLGVCNVGVCVVVWWVTSRSASIEPIPISMTLVAALAGAIGWFVRFSGPARALFILPSAMISGCAGTTTVMFALSPHVTTARVALVGLVFLAVAALSIEGCLRAVGCWVRAWARS